MYVSSVNSVYCTPFISLQSQKHKQKLSLLHTEKYPFKALQKQLFYGFLLF